MLPCPFRRVCGHRFLTLGREDVEVRRVVFELRKGEASRHIGIYLIFHGHPHRFQLSWAFEAALDIRQLPTGVEVSRRSAFPRRGKTE
jgi:hypothetical protein